jgi:thiol-disulfide isomerase/thioredoxin
MSVLPRFLVSFGTAAIVLLLMLSSAPAAEDGKMRIGEFIPQTPPQPAPEVSFTDADGNPATFADFKGKPVLVNLWATWCEPCLREMPSLDRLQAKYSDKLSVLAISEDRGGGKVVNPFVAKLELTKLKIYLDPKSDVGRAFGVRGLPTSIVIDAEGRVVGRVEGAAEWDSAKMLGVIEPLLKASAVRNAER